MNSKYVKEGVNALFKLQDYDREHIQTKANKKSLFSADENLILCQIELVKIPERIDNFVKIIPIKLPNAFYTKSSVCLVVKDIEKPEVGRRIDDDKAEEHYKDLMVEQQLTDFITTVLPLHQLRTEYNTNEARQRLFNNYDIFLVDYDLQRHIPKLLGGKFWRKNRLPIYIKINDGDYKSAVVTALNATYLNLSAKGLCCTLKVGSFGNKQTAVAANLLAVADELQRTLPGGWDNVKVIQIKGVYTATVPIYFKDETTGSKLSEIPKLKPTIVFRDSDVEAEDITTVEDALVRVLPNGVIKLVKLNNDRAFLAGKKHKASTDNLKESFVQNDGTPATKRKLPKSKIASVKKVQNGICSNDDSSDSGVEEAEIEYLKKMRVG